MTKLRVLDLFSGIGGFSLGLERTGGFETVAFCEIEEFPRRVLAKHWPEVPCHRDVRELTGVQVGAVDVICGGYPCQPFSTAGKRRGKKDDRHLWPEFMRLVVELRPSWVIGENVAGHISMGLDDVLSDLEGEGYSCRTFVIPACAVGAPHRRARCWIIAAKDDANADGKRSYRKKVNKHGISESVDGEKCLPGPLCEVLANTGSAGERRTADVANSTQLQRNGRREDCEPGTRQVSELRKGSGAFFARSGQWLAEPAVGRVADGVPDRVDRLKGLGNAVVPQIPELIGRAILQAEAST